MKKNDIALRVGFIVTCSILIIAMIIRQIDVGEWISFFRGFFVVLLSISIAAHVHAIKGIKKARKKIANGEGLPDCVGLVVKFCHRLYADQRRGEHK